GDQAADSAGWQHPHVARRADARAGGGRRPGRRRRQLRRQQGPHFGRRVFVRVGQIGPELLHEAIAHQGEGAGVLIGREAIVDLGQGAADGGDDLGRGRGAGRKLRDAGDRGGRERGGDGGAGGGEPDGDELIERPRRDGTGDGTDRGSGWSLGRSVAAA